MNKYPIASDFASQALDWLTNRGGIACWKSISPSNPDASWSSPATIRKGEIEGEEGDEIVPHPKPNWQCADNPYRIISDPADVIVYVSKEHCRLRISLCRNLPTKLTDASIRKVNAAVISCATQKQAEAWHEFDYATDEAVIYYDEKLIPLNEWKESKSRVGTTNGK